MAALKTCTTQNDCRIRKFIPRILKAFSWGAQVLGGGGVSRLKRKVLTLEVTNDNFPGVHCLELFILAVFLSCCIANTGRKYDNVVLLTRPFISMSQ